MNYFENFKEKLNAYSDGKVTFPIPYFDKDNRQARTRWLAINFLLLGISVPKTCLYEYLCGYDHYKDEIEPENTLFRNEMRKQLIDIIHTKGYIIDKTIKSEISTFEIRDNILDKLLDNMSKD